MSSSTELMLRPEVALWEQVDYMEKRRVFLQSYHFSRKLSGGERARRSLFRVRRLVLVRLRAARNLPRLLWLRLRYFWSGRARRFDPLVVQSHRLSSSSSSSDRY